MSTECDVQATRKSGLCPRACIGLRREQVVAWGEKERKEIKEIKAMNCT